LEEGRGFGGEEREVEGETGQNDDPVAEKLGESVQNTVDLGKAAMEELKKEAAKDDKERRAAEKKALETAARKAKELKVGFGRRVERFGGGFAENESQREQKEQKKELKELKQIQKEVGAFLGNELDGLFG